MRVKTCFAAVLLLTANLAPRPAVAEEPSAASCETCDERARHVLERPEFQRATKHAAARRGGEIPEPLTVRGQDPSAMLGAAGVPAMPPGGPYQRGVWQPGQGGIPDGYFDPTAAPNAVPGDPSSPMYPFPGISPFDYRHQQSMNKKGLWFWEGNNRKRQFYGSIDYITVRTKTPNGLVGNEDAESYIDVLRRTAVPSDESGELETLLDIMEGDPANGIPGFNYYDAVDSDVIGRLSSNGVRANWGYWNPDDSGLRLEFLFAKDDGDNDFDFEKQRSTRHPRNYKLFRDVLEAANFENFDPNDPGLPLIPDLGPNITFFELFEQNLFNLGGLPLDDGTLQTIGGFNFGGVTAPFDQDFILRYKSERYGGSVTQYLAPWISGKYFKLRPLVGARFVGLQEQFTFIGRDSGLLYDTDINGIPTPDLKQQSVPNGIDDGGDGIIDNAGVLDENAPPLEERLDELEDARDALILAQQEVIEREEDVIQLEIAREAACALGETAECLLAIEALQEAIDALATAEEALEEAQNEFIAAAGSVSAEYFIVAPPFTSYVDSTVNSFMGGPEIGIRYDLGGEKFKLWGQSNFALLGNFERIRLKGDNIGMTTRWSNTPIRDSAGNIVGETQQNLIPPTINNQHPNRFSDKANHAHVSPLFEQSIFAEAPIFEKVPLLNKIHILEDAQFRVGYTITWIGSVQRPEDAIVWQGNPTAGLFPEIKTDRSSWYSGAWSFGINFNY